MKYTQDKINEIVQFLKARAVDLDAWERNFLDEMTEKIRVRGREWDVLTDAQVEHLERIYRVKVQPFLKEKDTTPFDLLGGPSLPPPPYVSTQPLPHPIETRPAAPPEPPLLTHEPPRHEPPRHEPPPPPPPPPPSHKK